MCEAISAWVVVAADRSVGTSDELKNSEGWDAAIRADSRASKMPPGGGLRFRTRRPGAPLLRKRRPFPARRALPDQGGGAPLELRPYGRSQGCLNVGKRLRTLSARGKERSARRRSGAPSPPCRHGRQAQPERGGRQQDGGQEVPRGGHGLRQ